MMSIPRADALRAIDHIKQDYLLAIDAGGLTVGDITVTDPAEIAHTCWAELGYYTRWIHATDSVCRYASIAASDVTRAAAEMAA